MSQERLVTLFDSAREVSEYAYVATNNLEYDLEYELKRRQMKIESI